MSADDQASEAAAATEGVNPDLTVTVGAEDVDADHLDRDPVEDGVDPPEDWTAADRTGTTAREQREGETVFTRSRSSSGRSRRSVPRGTSR
ncbi:hypothetical protein [Gordonia paraffinivorans]|uniref:hypothetical protein n=1 Tax=Gordonia paraffinivorans TaxID=175628 RepID=UPI001445A602|nr:hypothetical protein [Gordonia paraffinivorans]